MIPLGDRKVGSVVRCWFPTYDTDMASVTITGLAVTDIEVYKDGSTTQRASDNGYALPDTDGIDFDGAVGIHGFTIDTSDNSDAGFFSAGGDYLVIVNAITVNAQTVRLLYTFSLGISLYPTTAGRNLNVDSSGAAQADVVKILTTAVNATAVAGYFPADLLKIGGTDVGAGTDPVPADVTKWDGVDVAVALPASGTLAASADCLTAAGVRGAVGMASANLDTQLASKQATFTAAEGVAWPANFALLGINGSGHVSRVTLTDVLTTYTGNTVQTGDAFARIGANGAGLSALPWNAAWDAEVQSEVADALGVYAPATAANLATVAGYLDTEIVAIMAVTDKLNSAMVLDGSVYQFTANALELAPTGSGGGGLDAAGVRAAIGMASANLDAQLAGKAVVGEAAAALATYDAPTKAEMDSALALLSTSAQMVKVLAAVYDGMGINQTTGVLTLSNGATLTFTSTARTLDETP